MKTARPYPAYTVSKKAEAAILAGHPWVYADEITAQPATPPENGSVADVLSSKGRYLGSGFVSHASKIRVRIFSRNASDRFDRAFWRRRLEYAWAYRRAVLGPEDLSACRVIHGEADQFPGLTVDRFGPVLVAQVLSAGMEGIKGWLLPLLAEVLRADGQQITGIYERNDVALRAKEGLAEGKGWLAAPGSLAVLPDGPADNAAALPGEAVPLPDPAPDGEPAAGAAPALPGVPAGSPAPTRTIITENGVRYEVDFENGQKTGFFLDQKYNRRAVSALARGKTVLDCFTHTGSFALNAALGGAKQVTAVDVSAAALETAQKNAALNGLEGRMDFLCADVFDLLPKLETEGKSPYDLIILDPPAFAKARDAASAALRGYKEINCRAMKLLPRGGYLVSASCTYFVTERMFAEMLRAAAADAHRQLRQIEVRGAAPDHPVLWGVPETAYLKCFLFQVI